MNAPGADQMRLKIDFMLTGSIDKDTNFVVAVPMGTIRFMWVMEIVYFRAFDFEDLKVFANRSFRKFISFYTIVHSFIDLYIFTERNLQLSAIQLGKPEPLIVYYSTSALKVSPWDRSPVVKPFLNHRMRCSDVPWVKESGTTLPWICFCNRSSPMALAACRASSISPSSNVCLVRCA